MAARTPWQATATAAAGEVTEGLGLGVSSAGSFLVRQHIVGVGLRSGHRRWDCRRNGWMMSLFLRWIHPVDRNYFFDGII